MDFLGLRNLTIIDEVVQALQKEKNHFFYSSKRQKPPPEKLEQRFL
jgi:DNA polymerase III alpha subunit